MKEEGRGHDSADEAPGSSGQVKQARATLTPNLFCILQSYKPHAPGPHNKANLCVLYHMSGTVKIIN